MKYLVAGLAACALVAPAYGADADGAAVPVEATTANQAPQSAVIEAAAQPGVLRAGTEIPLITREELTTEKKKLKVGHRLQMEVAANVEQGGVVIIPAGTPAIGEVTEVRNKGMWGKSGYINVRVVSLRLGDRNIRLSGTFDDKGVAGGVGAVAVSVVLIPVAGFFMTGTSAKIASGSPAKGFLEEDVAFRAPAMQPVAVQVTTASTPVASAQ